MRICFPRLTAPRCIHLSDMREEIMPMNFERAAGLCVTSYENLCVTIYGLRPRCRLTNVLVFSFPGYWAFAALLIHSSQSAMFSCATRIDHQDSVRYLGLRVRIYEVQSRNCKLFFTCYIYPATIFFSSWKKRTPIEALCSRAECMLMCTVTVVINLFSCQVFMRKINLHIEEIYIIFNFNIQIFFSFAVFDSKNEKKNGPADVALKKICGAWFAKAEVSF